MQSRWHRGVSTVRRERKREGEREKRGRRGKKNLHAYSLFSSSTDTLIMHITQTVTVLSSKTLNPGVEAKGGVWILTDTQTHSVHEKEHFVYQTGLSACLLILMIEPTFHAPAHIKKTWPGHAPYESKVREGRGLCYVSTFSCRSGLFCMRLATLCPGCRW